MRKVNAESASVRRKKRIRAKIFGTRDRPRLAVFRSNKNIYAQLIDDKKGHTMVSVYSKEIKEASKLNKTQEATEVGKLLAKKAQDTKITTVVFDRRGYKYHGRVKALADGARSGGLKF